MTKEKMYTPPDAVLKNMRRSVAINKMLGREPDKWFDEFKIKDEYSLQEVKQLFKQQLTMLDKSVSSKVRMPDGGPTENFMAYLSYGGSAGFSWTKKVLGEEPSSVNKSFYAYDEDSLNREEKITGFDLPIEKQHNEELMQVTYVAMLPDSTDLTGDYTSAEDVRKAMESFNKSAMRANLFHRVMTDKFHVVESYLAPTDFVLNEIPVKKGTWLMTLQVTDENVWKMIKSGDINGISIAGMATVISEEDE